MTQPAAPPWRLAVLAGRCPRCGTGKLFAGLLTLRDHCPVCGLDLRVRTTGGATAIVVISLLAAVVFALACWVEFRFSPRPWVHAVLWPAVALPLAILMMRTLRAAQVAPQLAVRAGMAISARQRLLPPAAITLAVCAALVGLGFWQLHRLNRQQAVLAQLQAAEAAPPVPLPFTPKPLQKVRVSGRWLADQLSWYGEEVRTIRGVAVKGAYALMPLQMESASVVLVDRGWMPLGRTMTLPAPLDSVTVTGWLWPSEEPGLFSLPDAPMVRRFHTLNTAAIAAALGITPVLPFVLLEQAQEPERGFPIAATGLPRRTGHQLGIAQSCFGLALAALVGFAVFAGRVIWPRRAPVRPEPFQPAEAWPVPPVWLPLPVELPEPADLPEQPAWPPPGMAERDGSALAAQARLVARFARIATIEEAAGMLSWDAAAVMPAGGAAARGDQLAVLAGLAHGLLVAPEVADDLDRADSAGAVADPWQAANLRLMRQAYRRASALPAELVEAQARANSACEKIWREARRTSDFPLVAPALREVVALVREQAAALAPVLGLSPYDALMDGYQRGIGAADVEPVFAAYAAFLAAALPQAEALQAARPAGVRPAGPFPAAVQEALCRHMSAQAGLEPQHSRLDRSAHPFCGGTPNDVRITTRYDEQDFAQALLGVMHETGHALYERGLPVAWSRQPVGAAAGMAVHESQSLIIEMQACRSDAFLGWLGRELNLFFGGDPAPYAGDNLGRLWRRVQRGLIRVEADEMTYPAHVILRFRLEQAIVSGDLAVADLPTAWNQGMRALLGVVPPDAARGCLQDIHWYDGAFGYFPSYTLGAMAAAQLMAAARREVTELDGALAAGDLAPLLGWLRERVHGMGSLLGFNDLLRHATGKPLDPLDFEAHLTARYLT